MLAARGVSLGLGRDINLSGLNQLSAADKALLGRIDRKKKASQQQKPKYIIKKHVDTKVCIYNDKNNMADKNSFPFPSPYICVTIEEINC
jgi:hypothetical protein